MKNKNIYYFILGGISLSLSFPPFPFFPLAFLSFTLILNGIEKELSNNNFKFFFKFYLTFFLYHTISNWWISSFQENTDPYLMISGFVLDLFHPLFFIIPMYVYLRIRKNYNKLLSILFFPIIWVSWEYFHSIGELSYPWLAVGNTQINNSYFVQIADIFGVWGVSLVIVYINVLIYLFIDNYLTNKRISYKSIIIVICLFIICYTYGYIRYNENKDESFYKEKQIKISVIQPNINPWNKWISGPIDQITNNMRIQDSLNKVDKSELSIWPETAILRINKSYNKDLNLPYIQNWLSLNNISVLSGFIHTYEYKENDHKQLSANFNSIDSVWEENFNSAILINGNEVFEKIYHKSKLTPFAERIPNLNYFSFLSEYLEWGVGISSWGLGQEQFNLEFENQNKKVNIAPIICIESIYPNFVREFTKKGANIISIITNDAWYDGTPGPIQHFNIARMRAIENRRYIARSANSGISGFISPNGEVIKSMKNMEKGGISYSLPILTEKSFYVEYGDILTISLLSLTVIIYLLSFILKRK